ncbi:hypothetical protein F5883DRAFT_508222 [Diaporthe sp. PMI_573]|nr:hypothetical protein F5883DRAFT_512493 [Diaporthaceae sp. PMI_573]KAH8750317.1 hypothetical protein F5883DRAFT_508222 [Diaporthaceae sp. PMI_573]
MPAPSSQKDKYTQSIGTEHNEQGFSTVFACPFQKSNPQKYHRCLKYTLNRIKDVKKHIYRQHTKPPYYCAPCYELFTSAGARDKHSRCADCEKRQPFQFEGISDDQRNKLKKNSTRKKSLHEQWFEMWDVIFPGCPRPQSAFMSNYIEEMVPLLRGFWNEKKAEIISDVANIRSGGSEVDSGLLADIMDSFFDRF